ncbi:hypothetical protein AB0H57_05990 [Micromonospora sp. NPDC050686]|uniref:hypothetical protein n=1 Tax=Micromonospora sp. NPDC050686 TaxID=3154631 RepID=UPI0033C7C408
MTVLPHLHLHLEPEQRKRAQLGIRLDVARDSAAFFAAHDIRNAARPAMSGKDLECFIHQVHAEQRHEGVAHVELRLSPRRFVVDGLPFAEFLRIAHHSMRALENPTLRGVLLVNRDSSEKFTEDCRRLLPGLPPTFVGIDLAGDESRYPDSSRFRNLFATARESGLGVTVHAGEFGNLDGVWRAIDELGAQRLGHALAAAGNRSLLKRLRDDSILVELSISSNLALGAAASASLHPARIFLEAGVPLSFNTDIPIESGSTIPQELAVAADVLGLSTSEVVTLQQGASRFIFRRSARR